MNQLAELVASFIYSECYSHQGTSSNGSGGQAVDQDAGSNPGSGNVLLFHD